MLHRSHSLMASLTDRFKYDLFLSFRGEDTRHGFTGNLWKALSDRGIHTFMDDEELQKGEEITPSLIKAIEDSNMAIIVLSKNYASSTFCLKELSTILYSIKDKGRCVWPVFYDVEPSDVRKLKRSYGEAMVEHEARDHSNMDLLQKWKNALNQVANLSGFHFKNGDEYEHVFIGKIVEQVSREIIPATLPVPDYLVGLEYQKQHVTSLLNDGPNDKVQMVGIHGIGGIGKTTLALAVYNSIVHQFQGSCFLEKVRENSDKNGLIHLQKILLSQVVGEKNIELTSVRQGISILQKRFHQKKVLLLLDDVDKEEQLEAIAGRSDWFGRGSRVIITTRDKRLLTYHGVERTYEVNGLNDQDAFELVILKAFKNKFSPSYKDALFAQYGSLLDVNKLPRLKAFKTDEVFSGYVHVILRAISYASGLPLALEVIGSHFFNKTIEQCKYALDRYERIPDKKIQTILQLSFDALQEEEKSVFLDIACCFKGYKWTRVEQILNAHYDNIMKDHIDVLVEKSLIKTSMSGNVTLHDLIEDMGKEIVRQESPEDPGKRSRLWSSKDIIQVLEENTGTSKIEIICPSSRIEVEWDEEAFKKMENLRTLIIMDGQFTESPKNLPNSLRILEHHLYPSWGLPSQFYPRKLAICKIPSYSTSFAWDDFFKKKFKNIRVLSFDHHKSLTRIPDISGLVNLEELSFQDCVNLITVDDSVGFLGNLKTLRAMRCIKLRSIPPLKLASLEELDLSQCSCLESFPPVVDGLVDKLKTMTVRSCVKLRSIPTLKLTSLEELDLSNCFSLESFPLVVDGFLGKLKILLVKYCRNLRSIPPLRLDSLEKLDLSHCYSLESFPTVVDGLLDKLKFLSMEHCVKLTSIPSLRLTSLERFNLSHCLSLERFPKILGEMNNITEIHLDNTLIQELPFPFQNLTPPQTLYQCNCGVVYLSNRAAVMSKLAEFTIQAEEKVSPMQSSHVEYICLRNCKFSDEYLSTGLMLFTNVKELHLSDNQFKILPKSIEKCHFLQRLVLDNCEELQEIEGIPPCLKTLSALNCKSLTSPCKSKLLNQELHEAGNTWFRLPRTRIPEWFDHQCLAGLSISFWFRNKFPVIALCVVSPSTWDDSRRPVRVIINGDTFFYRHGENKRLSPEVYHLHLFHMQMEKLNNNMDKALLENKWNHAEVDFGFPFMYSGIHVLKKKSNMKDIQFTNPDKDDNIELTQYKRNSDSLVSVIASDVDKCE
ncbi:putative TIR domain, winged helix-turn-helix DNA-binding domain-containing protein [Medicago truncatula]|uniref:Disease resistance protein (TIR-NBS-LRR class) n=1 Tax=Medicago truncatula TaxID=3880 RepID=A0A072UBS0_MEDTR|nr:disease resistance protein RPV1 isoform X1 [Medicago truncatula]KEH26886.1 disease resistance protein (TIR-NBS-LRR class) [Medicago truncatula]RHN52584.1 putative TIR domain, winged helix-turn-helix DNA-binding domain-containing protein [Medicago truncatula]